MTVRPGARRAFTLTELAVGVALLGLVLGILMGMERGAARGNAGAAEHSNALRSAMLTLETIQRDFDRIYYQCPERDLVMLKHDELGPGCGLAFRVPEKVAPGGSAWSARQIPLSFSLRKVPGPVPAYNLVRTETATGKETVLRTSLVSDLKVRLIPRSTAEGPSYSNHHAYIELVATGLGSSAGKVRYTASALLPLPRTGLPDDYPPALWPE